MDKDWLKYWQKIEGLETEEEEKTVHQCGCDYVQGYYHDRPLPIADFETKYIKN